MNLGNRGLREHLSVVTAVAVAVAVAIASLVVFLFTRQQLVAQLDTTLRSLAARVEPEVRPFPGAFEIVFDTGRLSGERGIAQFVAAEGGTLGGFPPFSRGEGLDLDGFDLLDPDPFVAADARARAVAAGDEPAYYANVDVGGTSMRMLTRQVLPGLALQVAQPLDEVNGVLSRLAIVLGGVVVAGALGAALLGRAIATSAVRRVAHMTSVAEDVTTTGDFGRRLEVGGSDELGRLAATFNSMLDTLEASIASQKQLVADASHELRTPLTSIRTNIEVLERTDHPEDERRRILADVTTQIDELSRLVTNIVEVARDGEPVGEREEVEVGELAQEIVERTRRLHPQARFDLDTEPWVVHGDRTRLGRALSNLIDNAVKYSTNGSPIDVRVAEGFVSVRDRGPGLADADMARIFDRFYRAPSARGTPGSGLGLAIAKDVAESHGGRLTAANVPEGGAIFTLAIPKKI